MVRLSFLGGAVKLDRPVVQFTMQCSVLRYAGTVHSTVASIIIISQGELQSADCSSSAGCKSSQGDIVGNGT